MGPAGASRSVPKDKISSGRRKGSASPAGLSSTCYGLMVFYMNRFLYMLLAIPVVAFAGETPPLDENGWFLNEGDCPFECCIYREWHVEQDTPILSKPFGTEEIDIARKGEIIEGITGIVYSKPVLFEVIKDTELEYNIGPFKRGDKFYLLAYAGEGFVSAWYQGNIILIDAYAIVDEIDGPYYPCDPDKNSCWWWVEPGSRRENDWWAKIRLPGGAEGWARPNNFGNIGGCG